MFLISSHHRVLELQTSKLIFMGLFVAIRYGVNVVFVVPLTLFYFLIDDMGIILMTLYGIAFNICSAGTLLEPLVL